MAARDLTQILFHHTASSRRVTFEQVKEWHVTGNGWADIGYHGFIDWRGKFFPGRPLLSRGARAGSAGNHMTGIAIAGWNGPTAPRANMGWTDRQIVTGQWVIDTFRALLGDVSFKGHRDVKATECPGLDVHTVFK